MINRFPIFHLFLLAKFIKLKLLYLVGMKMSGAAVHLCQLVSIIDDLSSVSTFETTVSDVSWLLTKFSHWHKAAFFLCYRGDKQVTIGVIFFIIVVFLVCD